MHYADFAYLLEGLVKTSAEKNENLLFVIMVDLHRAKQLFLLTVSGQVTIIETLRPLHVGEHFNTVGPGCHTDTIDQPFNTRIA